MIILALDTCFARCAACLYDSAMGRVLAEESRAMERGHAEALAPLVARLFTSAGLGPENLNRLAVTTGPGTFTGLRIGLSFARAFGLARNIPVVGCDTLSAVALSAKPEDGAWAVAHKAGQSGYYYVLRPGAEPRLEKQEDVAASLSGGKGLVLGTAAAELCAIAPSLRQDAARDLPVLQLLAAHAALLPPPAAMPEPLYLREADAKPQLQSNGPVRPATAGDLVALARLHGAAFAKAWPAEELAAMLSVEGTEALIYAPAQGQALGFILTRALAGEAEILTLAVVPEQRRKGIGKALLEAACGRLGSNGTARLFLEVNETNAPARALYAASGFADQGRRKAYYETASGRQDAILMARNLP